MSETQTSLNIKTPRPPLLHVFICTESTWKRSISNAVWLYSMCRLILYMVKRRWTHFCLWLLVSWLGPLSSSDGKSECYSISRYFRQQCSPSFVFLGRTFSVSTWQSPRHKSQLHKEMVFLVWCGRTWLACTESWPQPHPTTLGWTGTPTESQAWRSGGCYSSRLMQMILEWHTYGCPHTFGHIVYGKYTVYTAHSNMIFTD